MRSEQRYARVLRLGVIGAALIVLSACGDFERGARLPPMTNGGGNGGDLTFVGDVQPLLMAECGGCHGPTGSGGGDFALTDDIDADYATVLDLVNLDNPTASRLLAKALGQGHTGGAVLSSTSQDYTTILNWITAGAAR